MSLRSHIVFFVWKRAFRVLFLIMRKTWKTCNWIDFQLFIDQFMISGYFNLNPHNENIQKSFRVIHHSLGHSLWPVRLPLYLNFNYLFFTWCNRVILPKLIEEVRHFQCSITWWHRCALIRFYKIHHKLH